MTGASGWKSYVPAMATLCLVISRLKSCRELDRLELLIEQIKTVEADRDALVAEKREDMPSSAAMLIEIKGIGPEFAAML